MCAGITWACPLVLGGLGSKGIWCEHASCNVALRAAHDTILSLAQEPHVCFKHLWNSLACCRVRWQILTFPDNYTRIGYAGMSWGKVRWNILSWACKHLVQNYTGNNLRFWGWAIWYHLMLKWKTPVSMKSCVFNLPFVCIPLVSFDIPWSCSCLYGNC